MDSREPSTSTNSPQALMPWTYRGITASVRGDSPRPAAQPARRPARRPAGWPAGGPAGGPANFETEAGRANTQQPAGVECLAEMRSNSGHGTTTYVWHGYHWLDPCSTNRPWTGVTCNDQGRVTGLLFEKLLCFFFFFDVLFGVVLFFLLLFFLCEEGSRCN